MIEGSGNDWWSRATNRGVGYAIEEGAKWIFLVNNDTELASDCLANLREVALSEPNTLIGCKSLDISTGRQIYAGSRLNWWFGPFAKRVTPEPGDTCVSVSHLKGRGMLVPVAAFERIGLFDAVHFPQRLADDDFSYRANLAGFPLKVCLTACLFTHREETSGSGYRKEPSLRNFHAYLFSTNGPGNLKHFLNWAWRNCPRRSLVPYVCYGVAARIGGFIRYWVMRS